MLTSFVQQKLILITSTGTTFCQLAPARVLCRLLEPWLFFSAVLFCLSFYSPYLPPPPNPCCFQSFAEHRADCTIYSTERCSQAFWRKRVLARELYQDWSWCKQHHLRAGNPPAVVWPWSCRRPRLLLSVTQHVCVVGYVHANLPR